MACLYRKYKILSLGQFVSNLHHYNLLPHHSLGLYPQSDVFREVSQQNSVYTSCSLPLINLSSASNACTLTLVKYATFKTQS
jgi:hypothetical protein